MELRLAQAVAVGEATRRVGDALELSLGDDEVLYVLLQVCVVLIAESINESFEHERTVSGPCVKVFPQPLTN